MNASLILGFIIGYFLLLVIISIITSRNSNNASFFVGNHQSPWYILAYGMIGTSISGVSLVSVTGMVAAQHFSYLQIVFGYVFGYLLIAYVLLPMYYRLNLTSIYEYLGLRFGNGSHQIGSFYFLLSRTLGAGARLFLAATVMHSLVFSKFGLGFELTVAITLAMIYLYTFKAGIKTIVWTDTLQTTFLLLAIIAAIFSIKSLIGWDWELISGAITYNKFSEVMTTGYLGFSKSFLAGVFICVTMTGLDQGMMQRSLSAASLKDAQKNIISTSIMIVFVNLLFLSIGALLAVYVIKEGIIFEKSDLIFAQVATERFGLLAGGLFIMGLIAATFSSADDAMTALTTSFTIDILKMDPEGSKTEFWRKIIHLGVGIVIFLVIIIGFKNAKGAVINIVLQIASYTYGPLLGLYAFGLLTKLKVKDAFVPLICVLTPLVMLLISAWIGINWFSENPEAFSTIQNQPVLPRALAYISKGLGNEVIYYSGILCFGMLYLGSRFSKQELA